MSTALQDGRAPAPHDDEDEQALDAGGVLGLAGLAALSAALSGCGGGSSGDAALAASEPSVHALAATAGGADAAASDPVIPPVRPPSRLTREQAARFLAQAAFGGSAAEIAAVQASGRIGWIDAQFALPRSTGYVELVSPGGLDNDATDGRQAVERALWRKLISSPDVLRQRVTLALTEIFVVSLGSVTVSMRGYACAALLDILERNAFGNYRDLLMQVSTNAAMGAYLTFLNNVKADPATGSQPDENYAREVMQLFSIGLLRLNLDGTPLLSNSGVPLETYTQDDVLGMARVFTGWALSADRSTPYTLVTQPMRQIPSRHEPGSKVFLGTTIPAGTDGVTSLGLAVDTLMAHPNMGPFIGRQLIQRLVTSNPSPAYVARVATAFNGDAQRPKGDMQATLRAVLLDPEAHSDTSLAQPARGKLREPMVRFIQWARLVGLAPAAGASYNIGNLSDPALALAQSPLRAPSVFNFFRPGYVQPNSPLAALGLTTPEFQITNETSVAGYANFIQRVINNGIATMKPDYGALLPLATDSAALLAELNVVLAAGQLSAATIALLKPALDTLGVTTPAGQLRRVQAAVLMVMLAPEYLALK